MTSSYRDLWAQTYNSITLRDVLIFVCIIVGIINPVFTYAAILALVLVGFQDIYEVYKVAWNNPLDLHKPLQDGRGSGFFTIYLFSGAIIAFWFLSSMSIAPWIRVSVVLGIFVLVALLTTISNVLGVTLIQTIRLKRDGIEEFTSVDEKSKEPSQ